MGPTSTVQLSPPRSYQEVEVPLLHLMGQNRSKPGYPQTGCFTPAGPSKSAVFWGPRLELQLPSRFHDEEPVTNECQPTRQKAHLIKRGGIWDVMLGTLCHKWSLTILEARPRTRLSMSSSCRKINFQSVSVLDSSDPHSDHCADPYCD